MSGDLLEYVWLVQADNPGLAEARGGSWSQHPVQSAPLSLLLMKEREKETLNKCS